MITPAYGLTATERVLPKLALDFTTASLDPRITFTRTGDTATVVNSSGYVETVLANTARFSYDPATLVCKGLLIEESRTNLLTYSSEFDQAIWSKGNSSVTTNAINSPNNLTDGAKLVENTATSEHTIGQSFSFVSGTAYTFTVYAKQGERTKLRLGAGNPATWSAAVIFDLSNGTITNTLAGSGTIKNAGNGWYRLSVTGTAAATASTNILVRLVSTGTTISYTGDGVSGLYLWGAQFEAASFPTSYIPTTTAAVTRNADLATMTGTNFSDWYNATEGTFAVQANIPTLVSGPCFLSINDNTSLNRMRTLMVTATALRFSSIIGGAETGSMTKTVAAGQNNFCISYKLNDYGFATNGGAASIDTSVAVPTVSDLSIGSDRGFSVMSGTIGKIMYYPQRLINAEIQAFSKG
jgi:hypothetical protein